MVLVDVLRIIMVLAGFIIMAMTIASLARNKMTESFCLAWGFVALVLIFAGVVLNPYGINKIISVTGLMIFMVVGLFVIFGSYYVTGKVSELTRKNRELAIQVTLLNHENKLVAEQLKEIKEKLDME